MYAYIFMYICIYICQLTYMLYQCIYLSHEHLLIHEYLKKTGKDQGVDFFSRLQHNMNLADIDRSGDLDFFQFCYLSFLTCLDGSYSKLMASTQVCVCVCIFVCVCLSVCVSMFVCIWMGRGISWWLVRKYVCVYVYMYVYMCICDFVRICVDWSCRELMVITQVRACGCMRVCTCVFVCT